MFVQREGMPGHVGNCVVVSITLYCYGCIPATDKDKEENGQEHMKHHFYIFIAEQSASVIVKKQSERHSIFLKFYNDYNQPIDAFRSANVYLSLMRRLSLTDSILLN